MTYYGSPGPLTALMHAGIGAAGRIAGDVVSQKLMQQRLEEMFGKQSSAAMLTSLLQGQSPEDLQRIIPQIQPKLAELGIMKGGWPTVEAQGFVPGTDASSTERLMSLADVNRRGAGGGSYEAFTPATRTQFVTPQEDVKGLIGREGAGWFKNLPAAEKDSIMRAVVAPKDLSSLIAMMGLQQRGTAQQDTRDYRAGQQQLGQANLLLGIQKLQEQIAKSAETGRRLTSLEDLSARNRLGQLSQDMNLAYKSDDMDSARTYMDQVNSLIQAHPNLGIEPFKMEPGWKIPGLGWELGQKRLTGGKAMTTTPQQETKGLTFPRRVKAGGQEVTVNSQEEYDALKARYSK